MTASTPTPDVPALLRSAMSALTRGDKATARDLLTTVLEMDDRNEQAWLWLSGAVDSPSEQRICLENVLTINPASTAARQGLAYLSEQAPPEPSAPPASPSPEAPAVPAPRPAPAAAAPGAPAAPAAPAGPAPRPAAEPSPEWTSFTEAIAPVLQHNVDPAPRAAHGAPAAWTPAPAATPAAAPPQPAPTPPAWAESAPAAWTAAPAAARDEDSASAPDPWGAISRMGAASPAEPAPPTPAPEAPPPRAASPEGPMPEPAGVWAPNLGNMPPEPAPTNGAPPAAARVPTPDPEPPAPYLPPPPPPGAKPNPWANSDSSLTGLAALGINTAPPNQAAHAHLTTQDSPWADTFGARLGGSAGLPGEPMTPALGAEHDPLAANGPVSSPALIPRPPIGERVAGLTLACPNCDEMVPDNALSCPRCEYRFYAPCPRCGEFIDTSAPNPHGKDKCPHCEQPVDKLMLGQPAAPGVVRRTPAAAPTAPVAAAPPAKGRRRGKAAEAAPAPGYDPRVPASQAPAAPVRRGPPLAVSLVALIVILAVLAFAVYYGVNYAHLPSLTVTPGVTVTP
jgi:hypothetical protein